MIKIKKGHGTFRGLPSEIFEDMRGICMGIRKWLTDCTGISESEAEVFIDNAVLSSRTEAWNKALDAQRAERSDDEIFDELEKIGSALSDALKTLEERDKCRSCECCEECKEESENG